MNSDKLMATVANHINIDRVGSVNFIMVVKQQSHMNTTLIV